MLDIKYIKEKPEEVIARLAKKGKDGKSFVSSNGKEAILEYDVLEYNEKENCSLVSIDLKTGRHHQIRVQFASRGHYLLGDQRYGVQDNKQIDIILANQEEIKQLKLDKASLNAYHFWLWTPKVN